MPKPSTAPLGFSLLAAGWLVLLGSAALPTQAQTRPAAPAAKAAPPVTGTTTLRIEGLVATPRTLTAAEVAALPHREQATTDKEGKPHVYRGVDLADVLALAGAPAGTGIHGAVLAQAVLATGADGYQAVFALPEIDPAFAPQIILLADQLDGQPLPAKNGPYQLIVPLEKRPARWVRQLTGLRVVKVQ